MTKKEKLKTILERRGYFNTDIEREIMELINEPELETTKPVNVDLVNISVELPFNKEDENYLNQCNLYVHSDNSLKILTDNDEGSRLDREEIKDLITVLQKYVGN
jgi:hypothetical protein